GKPIDAVGIHQRSEIVTVLTLYAGGEQFKMADVVTTFDYCIFFQMEMCSGFEKQRTAEEGSCRHDNNTTACSVSLIDNGLYLVGLQYGAVVQHSMVSNPVGSTQLADISWCDLAEPLRNWRAIWKYTFCQNMTGCGDKQG